MGSDIRSQAPAAPPPPFYTEFSTHDATTTMVNSPTGLPEAWADVKTTGALMPGRGWTFAVGTVAVRTTRPQDNPSFSDRGIGLPPWPANPAGFLIAGATVASQKQVVVLQARGPNPVTPSAQDPDQEIRWQRYFYGESNLQENAIGRPATNARAVSVWPVLLPDGQLDPIETRIAICGESFECQLPNSQFANGNLGRMKFQGGMNFAGPYPRGLPSGFIAVYRGDGEHLWTHQFFFEDLGIPAGSPEGACAITDVSIRVEAVDGVMRDVVTYCGISSFGLRSNEATALSPMRAFDLGGGPAEGENNNGLGQWDGVVGRISNVHSPNLVQGTATLQEFHSVVGGREQDGLWGLAELPGNRFAVVGSTATMTLSNPAIGTADFPFTNGGPPPVAGGNAWPGVTHCIGTLLVFDASLTRSANPADRLILEASISLGRAGQLDELTTAATVARDVSVALEADPSGLHRIDLVGSTNDALLFQSLATGSPAPTTAFGGNSDGFLLNAVDIPTQPIGLTGTFQGGAQDGGWCGVSVWNEFLDHIAVLGWISSGPNNQDFEAASFFVDTATLVGPNPSTALLELRRATVSTPADEIPAAMGDFVATTPPLPAVADWADYGLGSPAGGGIAIDERGRLNLVGSTDPRTGTTSGFPVVGGPFARAYQNGIDACRIVPTMLPYLVGRSDRSGEQMHNLGVIPQAPAGRTGATTPTCALLPFGTQIGSGVVPALRRMLIDWEGPQPSPSPIDPQTQAQIPVHFLLVDRPPAGWQWTGTVVQFGVPTAPPPAPAVLPAGIENWVPSGVTTSLLLASPQLSVRVPLLLPPVSGVTFSAQVVTATLMPFSCTGASLAATPAIVFSY